MPACIRCKQAWSLFEFGDDDYLFILLSSCKVRATASTAAARSACAARFASCDSLLCRRAAHAPLLFSCSTLAYMHTHRAFACTRLAPRPRAISAIIEYVRLA